VIGNPRADSISELIDLDEAGQLRDVEPYFDDELWRLLTSRIDTPEQASTLPEPVWVYLASRWLEWEVGNGGFAQAAYNIPDWLPLGESAYRKLGLDRAALLIARARELLDEGERRGDAFDAASIHELFEQFAKSRLSELDRQLDDANFWAEEVRLSYVRSNREAFRRADATLAALARSD
jgi:hypothetical protein